MLLYAEPALVLSNGANTPESCSFAPLAVAVTLVVLSC